MKVLTIKLKEKTYTTGKITAFISREALKIQKESIQLAKKGLELQNTLDESIITIDKAEEILDLSESLLQKKYWLVCEAYQNKFTVDDLEKELSSEEIEFEINKILGGVQGIISKN